MALNCGQILLVLINGYIAKIEIDGWTIEQVLESLYTDREFLQQEEAIEEVNKIIHK